MSVTLNGTSGLVFGDGTTQGTAGLTGFRNRLINGAFDIWQRGTSRTFLTGAGGFLADRWSGGAGYQQGVHQRVAISSPPSGLRSKYALRSSSSTTTEASGGTRLEVTQKIENVNCYDLAGQTVTLSFWIRFSAATITSSTATPYDNWTVRLQQNTSTTDSALVSDTGDSVATVTSVSSGMVNASNNAAIINGSLPTTWTKYTVTFTIASSVNNISVRMESGGLGNTASADTVWYEVAEVQLEKGGAATEFERRPYPLELALCERYTQRVSGTGMTITANTGDLYCPFRSIMRTSSPSYSIISGSTAAQMNRSAYSYSISNGYYTGNDAVGFRATTTDPGITAGVFFFTLGSSVLVSAEM